MAVIGQSHLLQRIRVPDHIYHSNTIVRIVPTEVVPDLSFRSDAQNTASHLGLTVYLGKIH